ncbi:MAG: ferrochelatase [Myxococcales bacterium]
MNGLLLINLGTPDAPTTPAVRRYLREFLSDPRVIDLSPVGRWLLLNLVILPFRPAKSAHAYQKVWTDRGSPLLFHSVDFTEKVRARLGARWKVELGMRYGAPSLASALEKLKAAHVERLVVLPLYPQYSSAANGSSLEEIFRVLGPLPAVPPLLALEEFFDDPGFIDAFAAVGRPVLDEKRPDHVLFSFHGLPERQVKATESVPGHCAFDEGCCARISEANRHCYRAQSFATARLIAERLGLPAERWSVSFQSRLGRTPWIKPYTDEVLPALRARGVRRVAVFCPAFVADCLETLEEIAIRAREDFLSQGGEDLTLVPSLNATDAWVDAAVAMVRRQTERFLAPGA